GQRPHIKEISSQFKKELKKDVDKGWGVLVRLLAGRPGGRPRARAPAPHRSTERGLPESSGYPTSPKRSSPQSRSWPSRLSRRLLHLLNPLCEGQFESPAASCISGRDTGPAQLAV